METSLAVINIIEPIRTQPDRLFGAFCYKHEALTHVKPEGNDIAIQGLEAGKANAT